MPSDERRFAAVAAAAIALLVTASWIPFGFEVGPTLDEWRGLDSIVNGWDMFPAPGHWMRPLLFLPNLVAYGLSPDSFLGLNLVMALAMFSKGLLLFVLLRQLVPYRPPGLALLAGALFALYPAHGTAFWGTAMAGHFGQVFFLLALTAFLAWRRSRASAWLAVAGLALIVTCGLSETVYPLALMAPLLFAGDFRTHRRRFVIDATLWLMVPALFVLNCVGVFAVGATSYQGSLFSRPTPGQVVSSVWRAYKFALGGAWTTRVPLDGSASSIGLAAGVGATVGALGLVLWPGPPATSRRGLSARGLVLTGLVVIGAGYMPYLLTLLRDEPTRTMLYCSLGAALLWAVAVDTLAEALGRRRWMFAGASAVLVALALSKALAQHRYYRDWARVQQRMLRPIARTLEQGVRPRTVVLVDGIPDGVFAEGVLWSALAYLVPPLRNAVVSCGGSRCSAEAAGIVVPDDGATRPGQRWVVPYERVLMFRADGSGALQLASRLPWRWHVPADLAARYRPEARLSGHGVPAPRLQSALEPPSEAGDGRTASTTPCPFVWEFDRPIASGTGWEPSIEGRSAQWTTARRASMNLRLDEIHDHRVRIVIAYAISPQTLDSLRLEVNGVPVPLQRGRSPRAGDFVGDIPRAVVTLDPELTELAFLVDRLDVPPPPSADRRSLGLMFDRLEIGPAP